MKLNKGILEGLGRSSLPTQCIAQFVLASGQIGLCHIKGLVRVAQEISDIGLKRLLQVEELVAGLAVLRAEAGILELADGAGHAIQTGQRRIHCRVGLKSEVHAIRTLFKLRAPFLQPLQRLVKILQRLVEGIARYVRGLPLFRVHLRKQVVDAKFRDPDLVRKSFHLGRFHESRRH